MRGWEGVSCWRGEGLGVCVFVGEMGCGGFVCGRKLRAEDLRIHYLRMGVKVGVLKVYIDVRPFEC